MDARLAVTRALPDLAAARRELVRAEALQRDVWRAAVAACQGEAGGQAARILLPAINEMFDVATERKVAAETHVPPIILGMLAVLALTCSFLAGYGMGKVASPSWLQIVAFPLILAVTVYVILDLEYPRAGLIRITAVDQHLVDVRESMR
jgi:hypothetical protein